MVRSELPREQHPAVTPDEVAALEAANGHFALEVYRQLAAERQSQNFVWAPHSASVALAMTYAGAGGQTATEMASVMRWTFPPPKLHAAFNALDQSLAARAHDAVALHVADSLWACPSVRFERPFLDTLARDYDTGVRLTDFTREPERSRRRINTWVGDATHGAIHELLAPDSVPRDTSVALLQATYLHADWSTPFDRAETREKPFFVLDGTAKEVSTMHASHLQVLRTANDAFDAVELPYAGGDLVLDILMPRASLAAFESELTRPKLGSILGRLREGPLRLLSLPRFRLTGATFSLAKVLQSLGMQQTFDVTKADFSPMGTTDEGPIYLSEVLQQGTIAVDEKGTEAAAATAVVMGTGAGLPSDDDLVISIDHPFLFAVRDLPTGTILFMGRVVDPSR
jgi:serpin B